MDKWARQALSKLQVSETEVKSIQDFPKVVKLLSADASNKRNYSKSSNYKFGCLNQPRVWVSNIFFPWPLRPQAYVSGGLVVLQMAQSPVETLNLRAKLYPPGSPANSANTTSQEPPQLLKTSDKLENDIEETTPEKSQSSSWLAAVGYANPPRKPGK